MKLPALLFALAILLSFALGLSMLLVGIGLLPYPAPIPDGLGEPAAARLFTGMLRLSGGLQLILTALLGILWWIPFRRKKTYTYWLLPLAGLWQAAVNLGALAYLQDLKAYPFFTYSWVGVGACWLLGYLFLWQQKQITS